MKCITQQFTVHPVGQGLFYSGRINISDLPAHTFNFVFDCGSLNSTNAIEEVGLYRDKFLRSGTDLDLLIISHFDEDHVSHIERLLEDRKVKKVILPFSSLKERLYLVLRYIMQRHSREESGDFPISFMLDPIGSLSDYLDSDSEIFIVNSGQDKPFDGPANVGDFSLIDSLTDDHPIVFDLKAIGVNSEILAKFGSTSGKGVKIFDDNEKGVLKFVGGKGAIMDFLFYRRDLGERNEKFFDAVYDAFCSEFPLKSRKIRDLIKVVKQIKNGTIVKKIFKSVNKNFPGLVTNGRDIGDLNTTALCMLHHNLVDGFSKFAIEPYTFQKKVTTIKKFDGTNQTRIEDPRFYCYPYPYNWLPDGYSTRRFPNCLLSSDNFLKTIDEVNDFFNRYQNYWTFFWLFQVPHHGATSSSGLELLNRLPQGLTKFINHGAKKIRSWQHPSSQLINDLVASGQSVDVLPVNEFTGLVFEISYYLRIISVLKESSGLQDSETDIEN